MDHSIPIPDDLATLTPDQALDALTAINTALAPVHEAQMALQVIATAPSRVEQAAVDYAAAIGRQDGDPWTQPVGAHDAYRMGAVVTHSGKTWESTTPNNVWEPGVSGWREQAADDPDTGEPGVADFVQPTGAHDAYQIGDRARWTDGKIYESVIDNNAYSPSAYPAGWKLIG